MLYENITKGHSEILLKIHYDPNALNSTLVLGPLLPIRINQTVSGD